MGSTSSRFLVCSTLVLSIFTKAAVSSFMPPDNPQHSSPDSRYPPIDSVVLAGRKFATLQRLSLSGNAYTTTEGAYGTVTVYQNDSSRSSAITALGSRGFAVIRTDIPCSDIRKSPLLSQAYEEVVSRGAVVGCVGGPRPMLFDLVEGVPKMIPLKFTGGKAGASYSPRIVGAADLDIRVPKMLAVRTATEIVSVTITAHDNGGGGGGGGGRGGGGGGGGTQWHQLQVFWVDNATSETVSEWLFYIRKMVVSV